MKIAEMRMGRWAAVAGLMAAMAAGSAAAGAQVYTNPLNRDPLVKEAFQHFYDLDYPGAVARFEKFHQEHPGDPQPTALLLEAEVFQELYRLDLLDTTFYANDGFLSGKHATGEDPAAKQRILALANEAINEANWRIGQNANDVDALYARAWARALECTYIAMVERGFGAGFRLAMKAKDDDERVLQLKPDYVDAKLVVGIYQYVVGALPWPFKLLIGFAGVTGSKAKGMAMLEDAGRHGVITSVEARTAMALFLRREARYREAIEVVRGLKEQYPRDYLFWLEEANLRKDAGEGMAGVEAYRAIVRQNEKPGYFYDAQMELTYFGLGDALRGQRHYEEAAEAYEKAAWSRTVGPELKVRTLVAAGECYDVMGKRQLAVRDYQEALDVKANTSRADTARKYLREPYRGN